MKSRFEKNVVTKKNRQCLIECNITPTDTAWIYLYNPDKSIKIGAATLNITTGKSINIARIDVYEKNDRGLGYGSVLMDCIIDYMRDQCIAFLQVYVDPAQNPNDDPLTFYSKYFNSAKIRYSHASIGYLGYLHKSQARLITSLKNVLSAKYSGEFESSTLSPPQFLALKSCGLPRDQISPSWFSCWHYLALKEKLLPNQIFDSINLPLDWFNMDDYVALANGLSFDLLKKINTDFKSKMAESNKRRLLSMLSYIVNDDRLSAVNYLDKMNMLQDLLTIASPFAKLEETYTINTLTYNDFVNFIDKLNLEQPKFYFSNSLFNYNTIRRSPVEPMIDLSMSRNFDSSILSEEICPMLERINLKFKRKPTCNFKLTFSPSYKEKSDTSFMFDSPLYDQSIFNNANMLWHYRHNTPEAQHEFDKRYGLIKYSN